MTRYRWLSLTTLAAGLALAAAASAQETTAGAAPEPQPTCPMGTLGAPQRLHRGHGGPALDPSERRARRRGMGWRGPAGGGPDGAGPLAFFLGPGNPLQLSPGQAQQLRTLAFDFRKGAVAQEAAVRMAALELEQLSQAQPADARKVEAKIREVFARRADLAVAACQARLAAAQILTPEQRAKAEQLRPMGGPCLPLGGPDGDDDGPDAPVAPEPRE
jgi:Spy/CpxP family protein refolding chaperone